MEQKENIERVYTEVTSLLKEIWNLYSGKKSGNPNTASFFCNTDQYDELGNFDATLCQETYFTGGNWGEYHKVNEQEFIRLMEFEQELIDKAEDNLESNRILVNAKKSQQFEDVVNAPRHYTDGKIEVIDFIEDKGLGFHLGNSVKYVARAGKKDPNKTKEDLNKAIWYIKRYIDIYLTDDEAKGDS